MRVAGAHPGEHRDARGVRDQRQHEPSETDGDHAGDEDLTRAYAGRNRVGRVGCELQHAGPYRGRRGKQA